MGLIGRKDGPQHWLEPATPLTTKQEFKFKIPESPDGGDVTISLASSDAGDGNVGDYVVWQSPRLVSPGKPDLLLRDVRSVVRSLTARRAELFGNAAAYLNAADEVAAVAGKPELASIAKKYDVPEFNLRAWA